MNWKVAYRKIMRAKGYKVRFVWIKAFADIDDKEIRINLHRSNPPGRNFVHELAHFVYPEKSHKEIYAIEKEVWENLSIRQKHRVYKRLFSS